jgi:hypothetical protein
MPRAVAEAHELRDRFVAELLVPALRVFGLEAEAAIGLRRVVACGAWEHGG